MTSAHGLNHLMTPTEVARLFRVDRGTVTKWARQGRIASLRTPGGHHRFPAAHVMAMLRQMQQDQQIEQLAADALPQDTIPGLNHSDSDRWTGGDRKDEP